MYRSCLHSGVKQNYVDFLPNLPVESLECSQLTSHASVALLSEFGTQFLLSTQPESRLHCGNTPECFACFLAEFVFRPRTTPPQTDLRVNLYFLPRRVLSPKHIFFNTIKPLLVLKSSPSRTNTNLNTLQCSFPKTPLNTAFISPIPQNPSIPPNLLSHNRKSFGLRRWPLQGYDRWSGARSARFLVQTIPFGRFNLVQSITPCFPV